MSDNKKSLSLEERITRLEDIEAIKKLKYQYAAYCDDKYNPDGMVSIFTPDARWVVSGVGGDARGHAELRKVMASLASTVTWALHYMIAPSVELAADGQSATGKFYLFCLFTLAHEDDRSKQDAMMSLGKYTDKFVKLNGRWYFKELNGVIDHGAEWTKGWVQGAFKKEW